MTDQTISVIMPCYNSARYVSESIKSVLRQTQGSVELIAVDDGSTDDTPNILKGFSDRIRIISQDNAGIGAARNAGIEISKGNFFAFLDSDDLWPDDKLANQLNAFEQDHDLDVVAGWLQQFLSPDISDSEKAAVQCDETPKPCRLPGALMVRRDSFLRVGPFDAEHKLGESVDWIARAQEANLKFHMLEDIVLRRRIHNANAGIELREHRGDYARVIKQALDRRRRMTQEESS